jgi:hypothetical protein
MEESVKHLCRFLAVIAVSFWLFVPPVMANQSITLSTSPAGITIQHEDRQGITLKLQLSGLIFRKSTPLKGFLLF